MSTEGITRRTETTPRTRADAGKPLASYPASTVGRLMSKQVHRVGVDASLNEAARLMWDRDIGAVPVVDGQGKVVGMVTDRDIAMAAYIQGKPLTRIPVRSVMSRDVISLSSAEPLHKASTLMRRHQIRRLPIVDEQGVASGMLTLSDLARSSITGEGDGLTEHDLADTLCSICAPRTSLGAEGETMLGAPA
ncbi:MAG: CBS domain-containing protein [Gemmatimonadota bacterium]